MTDQQAKLMIETYIPGFGKLDESIQGVCITAYKLGHSDGFDQGFQTARIAETVSIKEAGEPPVPPQDLATITPGASPLQSDICGSLNEVFNNQKR